MAGPGRLRPQLADLWGGPECWGEGARTEDRWRQVLASGSRAGQEITRIWEGLQQEKREVFQWLGEEEPKVLACGTAGIGDGSVNGETRRRLTEARENWRAKVLAKGLEQVRPKSTRAAWAWRQRDRVSSAWLLALPGAETSLSSAEFAEGAASNLCLPSPACRGRVGEPVKGRVVIVEFGDKIQATSLKGDHWRSRHDAKLHLIHRLCQWSGLQCTMEVFNLFSGEVRQEGLSRAERNRYLQAMVLDFRISMPAAGLARGGEGVGGGGGRAEGTGERIGAPGGAALAGQNSQVLHELKIISCNSTRYKPTVKARAVDIRAKKLPAEYLEKARAADRRSGTPEGEVGRVEAKLVGMGEVHRLVPVAGNFGEVSTDTDTLVAAMANSRVRVTGPSRGRRERMRRRS